MDPGSCYPSPDGRWIVRTVAWEARMSHWIELPEIIDATSGARLLAFVNPNWSLDRARWMGPARVELQLRRYPGDHVPPLVFVEVDCAARSAMVDGLSVALPAVEATLDGVLRRA